MSVSLAKPSEIPVPSLVSLLSDTEDATLIKSASAERITKVRSAGRRDAFQSGESRAWGRSGNVD